ncbi:MAG: hypothetical protein ACREJ5_04065 [Geminicoccaceae bacterium]
MATRRPTKAARIYEENFHVSALKQVAAPRARHLAHSDVEHLMEDMEGSPMRLAVRRDRVLGGSRSTSLKVELAPAQDPPRG